MFINTTTEWVHGGSSRFFRALQFYYMSCFDILNYNDCSLFFSDQLFGGF